MEDVHYYTIYELDDMVGEHVLLTADPKDKNQTPSEVVVKCVNFNANEIYVKKVGEEHAFWINYGQTRLAFEKGISYMKLFHALKDSEVAFATRSVDLNVWNAGAVKDSVEKKLLSYMHDIQEAATVDEVRKIIVDLKYGVSTSEWMNLSAPRSLPVNPQSYENTDKTEDSL